MAESDIKNSGIKIEHTAETDNLHSLSYNHVIPPVSPLTNRSTAINPLIGIEAAEGELCLESADVFVEFRYWYSSENTLFPVW